MQQPFYTSRQILAHYKSIDNTYLSTLFDQAKMVPKRKLIKKLRSRQQKAEKLEQFSPQSLLERLQSINTSHKEEAITILANLHVVIPEMGSPQFIQEIIKVLYQNNNLMVYETLFAISNMCELQPGLVRSFFDTGLDKALMQLNSTDKELLKPILMFFITIVDSLPQKYQFLVAAVLKSLTIDHLQHNTQLVLEFLFRMHPINRGSQSFEFFLSEEMAQAIAKVFKETSNMVEKSYAGVVLVISIKNQNLNSAVEALNDHMVDLLVCIDLQKQYQLNFVQKTTADKMKLDHETGGSMEDEADEQLEDEEEFDEESNNAGKTKEEHKAEVKARQEKMKVFSNTIAGIEILLEFILNILENNEAESTEQYEEFSDEEQMEENQTVQTQSSDGVCAFLKEKMSQFLMGNLQILPKFLSVSCAVVPGVENIVYLFYHLLMHIDKELIKSKNEQQIVEMAELIQISLNSIFESILPLSEFNSGQQSMQQKASKAQKVSKISTEEYQTLVECLEIGLKVLLKNKARGVRQQFLVEFSTKYMANSQTLSSEQYLEIIKPSWILMLEIFSKVFNPETNKQISQEQNYQIGSTLKRILLEVPYQELEELRCQVLDTLFDVYSNEQFDEVFVQLQFKGLLEMIIQKSPKISKNKSKSNKRNRFVHEVLKDVKRFLEYKKKMIKGL